MSTEISTPPKFLPKSLFQTFDEGGIYPHHSSLFLNSSQRPSAASVHYLSPKQHTSLQWSLETLFVLQVGKDLLGG